MAMAARSALVNSLGLLSDISATKNKVQYDPFISSFDYQA
jgi:hypothetical protein